MKPVDFKAKVRIGRFFLDERFFESPANKTIGKPIVGPDMETILENRRNVTSLVNREGKQIQEKVYAYFMDNYGLRTKLSWSKMAGCSMCPCSPGFRIVAIVDRDCKPYASFKENCHFRIFTNADGDLDIRQPKNSYLFESLVSNVRNKAIFGKTKI